MRITKSVFLDMAIWMIGFGVLVGLVFPFFAMLLDVPASIAISGRFFVSCVLAGCIVGLVNILLAKYTVRHRLKELTEKMEHVKSVVVGIADGGSISECKPELCHIPVDSADEFGGSAKTFNELVNSFAQSLRMLETVRSYTETLSGELEIQSLGEKALGILVQYASANAGALLIEKEGEIELLAAYGMSNAQSLCNDKLVMDALLKGEQYALHLPDGLTIESVLTTYKPKEIIVEPIKFKNVPIAVIVLASAHAFANDFKRRIGIFSHGFSISLNNAIEHEQLQRLAALDPLTGIYNRRFGLKRLHEEFSRSLRTNLPLGVLMLDIDHFKFVNDTYGHIAGDRVIINMTQIIRRVMRAGDIFVRYGGEEFLLILPGASRTDAFETAERIRNIVKESSVAYGSYTIGVTVSIGCESYPELQASDETTLITKADEALYRAKNTGRDRTIVGR